MIGMTWSYRRKVNLKPMAEYACIAGSWVLAVHSVFASLGCLCDFRLAASAATVICHIATNPRLACEGSWANNVSLEPHPLLQRIFVRKSSSSGQYHIITFAVLRPL